MYTLIGLFYIALLGIIAMILLKRLEVKTGAPSLVSRIGKGSDRFFHASWNLLRTGISYFNRRTFILMAQWLAYHVLLRIRRVYVEMKHRTLSNPHGRKVIDAVRGKGEVKDHGASFYLRRISDRR
jgi:preprotein translocase subunit SecG